MEQNGTNETLRRATQHLQQLLLRTPGKSHQHAANEAEAIAYLAFAEGNPVRDLFVAAASRAEPERPRSPSPTGTIRPKSSKGFFNKFSRGRDKSAVASASAPLPKHQPVIEGVTPEFMRCFGPIEDKKPKRKERASDTSPPTSSTGTSKGVPVNSFGSQKPVRTYEQYKCIVCDQELSSKGVCKRHLEDQHISPRVFECEGCHAYFDGKPDAKKHCNQCGNGESSFVTTKLSKRIYACEFTGDYFLSQGRYIDVLLALSEKKSGRPKPNLSDKLAAILRYWGYRNDTKVLPLCREISQSFFGSSDAWEKLQWDEDALRPKITFLEHATFNEDGWVESARWGGSTAEKRRSTQEFLFELLTSGRLPGGWKIEGSPYVKPAPTSVCSTPMPLAYTAPSVASGPSSVGTPLSGTSPMPRSHSRQTAWNHDGMSQSTTASTPRSAPNGEEVMTAELKSKRHLSDESRSYIPARTPPGPSELLDHYPYQADPAAPQLPPLPDFMTPSHSTISLPLRKQEGDGLQSAPQQPTVYIPLTLGQYPPHMYAMNSASSSHTLTSDVASETSTLAQSYREPEYLHAVSDEYVAWQQQQQQYAYQNGHPTTFGYGSHYDYSMPDDASMIASSINTGNTVGVDYVTELPKMESYPDMDLTNHRTHPGTFYLPDDGDQHRR